MDVNHIGKLLDTAGWQQGTLLPPQVSSVVFQLDSPLTTIARRAQPDLERQYQESVQRGKSPSSRRVTGFGTSMKPSERLVVITQTCDIVKSSDVEPVVWAIRAFFTKKAGVLALAGGNSKRQFLLDDSRGLVAEMSHITAIEKPTLLELNPEPGAPDEATRRRFADWLADRFSRIPQDDEIVHAVISPILDGLHTLQKAHDSDLMALESVREVRFAKLQGRPPYDVRLVFMVKSTEVGYPDEELDKLVGHIKDWLEERGEARLVAWDTATPGNIVLEDYLNTDKLDLDEYTYRGRTVQGLVPIPRL